MFTHRTSACQFTRATLLAAFLSVVSTLSAALDNKGTDFILSFNPNNLGGALANQVELHFTGDVATNVTVHYPVNAPTFTTTVAVVPGSVTIVTLPVAASTSWVANTIQNNAVRAFAPAEFVCYMINRRTASSDAALALPIDTMNTEHIVTTYNALVAGQFTVVAAFDNTTVTIVPNNALNGRPAGVPFNITLNRGQGYFGRSASSGAAGSLTGTLISADRPVGMTNGNECTNVPTGVTACDHIFEVSQPVQSWGNRVLVANLPLRANGTIYRIVASQNATNVTRNGVALGTINRGQFIETPRLTGNHVFEANNPIFVTQFMTGQGDGNSTGDPAMGNMIPAEQYLNSYTFSTVGGSQFAQNFVTVIARNVDIGLLLLDGSPIPAGSYTAIPGTTFLAATVALTQGVHTTSSVNPHGITVIGYNSFDSYIYPGGALFQFINPQGDANAPVCTVVPSAGPPPSVSGVVTDNRPTEDTNSNGVLDPGEDLNSNGQIDRDTGVFFVQLQPGAVNLTLTVVPFVPGDPSVMFTVTLTNPALSGSGTVVATDGAGNTCQSIILLEVSGGNNPPVTSCVSTGTASSRIYTVFVADDKDAAADVDIYINDSVGSYTAGPFKHGDVIVVRTNPVAPQTTRALTGAQDWFVQLKGQPLFWAEDTEGAKSTPSRCDVPN